MELPRFWAYLQGPKMAVDTKGVNESWVAPVVRMVAPQGFGESVWIDEIPETVIAFHIAGAEASKTKGVGTGKSTQGGNFTPQPKGTPNYRWRIERRIERAKQLLTTAELGLAEIALAWGFADQSHFTAAFRKLAGMTPGGYRQEFRA